MPEWRLLFPKEELDVRSMCLDPSAVIYTEIINWIQAQGPKVRLTPEEVLDCMWYDTHGDHMTKYCIFRAEIAIPDNLPEEMRIRIKTILKDFTNG